MSKEQGFIARWSQKKLTRRHGLNPEGAVSNDEAKAASSITDPIAPADPVGDPPSSEELPPIDSLTKDSDFAPFLRVGVPAELRLAALRKLWTSDPVWALPERLDIHNLDYTFPRLRPRRPRSPAVPKAGPLLHEKVMTRLLTNRRLSVVMILTGVPGNSWSSRPNEHAAHAVG
jgi:hypothetical protein